LAALRKYRDLWRFRAPLTASEIRRTERWLATARVALAIAALVTLWMDSPGRLLYPRTLYWLLTVYLVHSVVVMLLVRFRQQSTRSFRLVVHGADIVWPVLISVFTPAQSGPFFLFFVFVMAAAAYRWGLWETVGTAAGAIALLWLAGLAVEAGIGPLADSWLQSARMPHIGLAVRKLDSQQLFMTSVYLMVLGFLLGYLGENQKKLRAERTVINRVLSSARVELGITGTMEQILGEMLNIYRAGRVVSASQETNSYRVFLAEINRGASGTEPLRWREATPETETTYLNDASGMACYVAGNGKGHEIVALDGDGRRVREPDVKFVEGISDIEDFHSMVSVGFAFGREWTGRVFLFDPEMMGDPEDELRFLQEFSQQVGPAVYNVYLMRRLRERAGAAERARFARELHDGAIQSLIAVEMQVDVLRRQSGQAPVVMNELSRIQQLLREEVLKLRELMQAMKSFEVDSERLIGFLIDTVERFRRETGISAEFISEMEKIELPQKVCRELARIVQESLVNVRKHAGAQHVLVRLGKRGGFLQLTVEDDGRGFPFSGTLTQNEMETRGKGPLVIRERVRSLAGELTVESNPGHGARLEIRIPPSRQANRG
jgi:signal transduction histidine kinase